jgi:heat shock protein HslJ
MKSQRILAMLFVIAAVAALAACGPAATEEPEGPELASTRWMLQTLDGQPLIDVTTITAEFAEGRISGSAGCNQYFGSYETSGNELTIREIGSTEMFCMEPEGIMEQEQAFLSALGTVGAYQVEGGQLEMLDADGNVVLTFVAPEPEPEVGLETTQWVFGGFVEGDVINSPIAGTRITLQFGQDVARGSAGCNDYGASYTVQDGELEIGEIERTAEACTQPAGVMEQEERYIDALARVTAYELEDNLLTLRISENEALLFTAGGDM